MVLYVMEQELSKRPEALAEYSTLQGDKRGQAIPMRVD